MLYLHLWTLLNLREYYNFALFVYNHKQIYTFLFINISLLQFSLDTFWKFSKRSFFIDCSYFFSFLFFTGGVQHIFTPHQLALFNSLIFFLFSPGSSASQSHAGWAYLLLGPPKVRSVWGELRGSAPADQRLNWRGSLRGEGEQCSDLVPAPLLRTFWNGGQTPDTALR